MGKNSGRGYKRRSYLVKRGLQGRFILGFSLLILLGLLINVSTAYFFIDRELAEALFRVHLKIKSTSEIVWPVLWKMAAVVVPAGLVAAAALGYYLTRNVEVPLLSLLGGVRRIASGDMTTRLHRVRFEGVPDAFNKMAAELEKDFHAVKGSVQRVDGKFHALRSLASEGAQASELVRALHELRHESSSVREEVSRFKL